MDKLINLHFFDGEGAESGTTAADTQQQGETQASSPEAQESTVNRQKAYDDFKKANKDLFTADFQDQFNKRFKSHKELESKVKAQDGIIGRLYDKYHVADIEALNKAMDSDDSLFIEAADEAGMTIDQYKQFKALERQNKELLEAEKQRATEEGARRKIAKWQDEGEMLKAEFPNFNLQEELQDQTFANMLANGFTVKDAYRTVHFDDIMNNAIGSTAMNVEKAVVNNIRAKGSRPQENGAAQQGAFITKGNVSSMSDKDILEIAERVKNGEMISF